MSTIDELRAQLRQIRADLGVQVRSALTETFKTFFGAHPEVKSIVWTQYVPSFNDGDPCLFTLGDVWFSPRVVTGSNDAEDYENDEDAPFSIYDNTSSAEMQSDMRSITEFLSENEDVLEEIYGANAEIVVTPEKVTVSDYDCGY